MDEIFQRATKRFRPIIITTVTTVVGMLSLILFPKWRSCNFQPIAIALGFGLCMGNSFKSNLSTCFIYFNSQIKKST